MANNNIIPVFEVVEIPSKTKFPMLTSGTTPSAPGGGLATPVAIAIKVK